MSRDAGGRSWLRPFAFHGDHISGLLPSGRSRHIPGHTSLQAGTRSRSQIESFVLRLRREPEHYNLVHPTRPPLALIQPTSPHGNRPSTMLPSRGLNVFTTTDIFRSQRLYGMRYLVCYDIRVAGFYGLRYFTIRGSVLR